VEESRIHNLSSTFFFENLSVYEIMWRNCRARKVTNDNIVGCMRIACRVTKTADKHKAVAFPRQPCCANAPHWYVYTYTGCLVRTSDKVLRLTCRCDIVTSQLRIHLRFVACPVSVSGLVQ
jgi:hypothetical protein